jgi:predicted RNA-binding Zn ribbon-like protein
MNSVRLEPRLVAGNLALDFVNTSTGREFAAGWGDCLTDAFETLVWLRSATALDERRFRDLMKVVATDEQILDSFLKSVVELRSALSGIFGAVLAGSEPSNVDLSTVNNVLAQAHGAERLVWTPEGGKIARVLSDQQSADDALWPVAVAAEAILTTDKLRRVKICGSATCQWLFLDTSKNGSRAWCQMAVCGNREKGRRRLKREREQAPSR